MVGCGWMWLEWLDVVGCGWMWLDVVGCGRMWSDVVEDRQTHPNTSEHICCRLLWPPSTIHLLHLHTTTMAPSATVHPAAFGHLSITTGLIDTKFEETIADETFNSLVKYGSHQQFNRYHIRRLLLLCMVSSSLCRNDGDFQIHITLRIFVGRAWFQYQTIDYESYYWIIIKSLHGDHYYRIYDNYSTGERPPPIFMPTRRRNTLTWWLIVHILNRSNHSFIL